LPVTKADQGIKWGEVKTNTTGNSRSGAKYQVGFDPQTGQKYHRYPAEAGGVPAEVIGLKQTAEQKAQHKRRRALRSKMK
jgi:hypothetical protein